MRARARSESQGSGPVSDTSGSGPRFRGQPLPPGSQPGFPASYYYWFQWGSQCLSPLESAQQANLECKDSTRAASNVRADLLTRFGSREIRWSTVVGGQEA